MKHPVVFLRKAKQGNIQIGTIRIPGFKTVSDFWKKSLWTASSFLNADIPIIMVERLRSRVYRIVALPDDAKLGFGFGLIQYFRFIWGADDQYG